MPFAEGIDVASPQGKIDWPRVRTDPQRIEFAICKATQGARYVDPFFHRNVDGAHACGIEILGAYHWLEPAQDPVAQAEHFAATCSRHFDRLAIFALDFEDDDRKTLPVRGARLVEVGERFVEHFEARTQRRLVIYTGKWFWDEAVDELPRRGPKAPRVPAPVLAARPLWHSQYPGRHPRTIPGFRPALAEPWAPDRWALHQYSGNVGVPVQGISVAVDRNRFNGDSAALRVFVEALDLRPPVRERVPFLGDAAPHPLGRADRAERAVEDSLRRLPRATPPETPAAIARRAEDEDPEDGGGGGAAA